MSVSGGSGGTAPTSSRALPQRPVDHARRSDGQRYNVRGRLTQQVGERIELDRRTATTSVARGLRAEGEQSTGVLTGAIIFTPPVFNPAFNANLGRYPYNPVQGVNPFDVIPNWQAPEDVSASSATSTRLPARSTT